MIGQAWASYTAAVSKLSLRERVLVLAAALAVVAGLSYLLAVEPVLAARARRAAEATAWQAELTALHTQVAQAAAVRAAPAAQGPAQRVQALQARLAELRREIDAIGADDAQVGLLRPAVYRLLSRHERVQLVALEASTAAPGPVAADAASVPQALQRYTVCVTLAGSYLDLLSYLEALERELPDVRWGDMTLGVRDGGGVRLTLNLSLWWRPA